MVSPTTACAASIMGISCPSFLQPPPVRPASWASAALRFSNHHLCGQHQEHQLPMVSPTTACAASIMGISCPSFLQPPPVRPASWALAAQRFSNRRLFCQNRRHQPTAAAKRFSNHRLSRQRHEYQLPCVSATTACSHKHQRPFVSPTNTRVASIMGISCPAFLQPARGWLASWASAAERFSNHRLCGKHRGHQLPCVFTAAAEPVFT